MAKMMKPVVAVDVDEVIAEFIPMLAKYHNDLYGTDLTTQHFDNYEFHLVWGGTKDECSSKVDAFFCSEYVTRLSPIPGALESLLRLKEKFSLHIVTARQHRFEQLTRRWISAHYPDIFDELHFGNHYSSVGVSRSKAQMCKDIGALFLIDDSFVYAKQCASQGIHVILFGSYPWNKTPEVIDTTTSSYFLVAGGSGQCAPLVQRAATWADVECAALQLSAHTAADASRSLTSASSSVSLDFKNPSRHIGVVNDVKFTVACVQLCSTDDKAANLAAITRLVSEAATAHRAKLVCLPECCIFMGKQRRDVLLAAEPIQESQSLTALRDIARSLNIWLSIGGFPELCKSSTETAHGGSGDLVYNTHLLVAPDGALGPIYRKIHLFDNPLTNLFESSTTAAGGEIVVADCRGRSTDSALGVKIGMSICYDLRFPQMFAKMCEPAISADTNDIASIPNSIHIIDSSSNSSNSSDSINTNSNNSNSNINGTNNNSMSIDICVSDSAKVGSCASATAAVDIAGDDMAAVDIGATSRPGGASLVLVPAAFTVPTGEAHWEVLLRCRAIENQVYICAAAQSGQHNENRRSYGHSMIVDPWGKVIAECQSDGEGICIAEFDGNLLNKIRSDLPVWSHRRSDIYN